MTDGADRFSAIFFAPEILETRNGRVEDHPAVSPEA